MSNISKVGDYKYIISNPNDCIQKTLLNGRVWNRNMLEYIETISKKYNVKHLLNIGAHIGTMSIPLSKNINRITAIEAYPPTYKLLLENIKLNGINNIKTYNFAVGDKNDKVYFLNENHERLVNNSGGMHVINEDDIKNNIRSANLSNKKIIAEMRPLNEMKIDKFELMLIDIEGSEDRFLKGAKEIIEKYKPIIIIEIWDNNKRKEENMKISREDIINIILSMKYQLKKQIDEDFVFFPI